MAAPRIHLFGNPHLLLPLGVRHELPNNLPGFLAAWLALRGDWVDREAVAVAFWPDMATAQVLQNLRVNLHRLKAWLDGLGMATALHAEKRRLRLQLPTDVGAFRAAFGAGQWEQALALYGGPFMQGATLAALPAVDAWAQTQRQTLARARSDAALRLTESWLAQGRAVEASALLRRLLEGDADPTAPDDPGAEELLQALLRAAPAAGDATAALALYQRHAQRQAQDLGLQPLPATQALAAALVPRAGREAGPVWSSGREAGPLMTASPAASALAANGHAPAAVRAPAADPRPLPARLAAPALVGRARELEQLRAAVAPGRLVLLRGEPGIGKTRLAEALWPHALWLACRDSAGLGAPLQAMADHLADHVHALQERPLFQPHRRTLARLLPELLPPGEAAAPAAAGDAGLHTALLALLHDIGRPIVLDDLQWADADTRALLEALRQAARLPLLATQRPGAAKLEADAVLDLAPFDTEAMAGLVAEVSGQSAPAPRFTQWLQARSAGNPLFALEALRTLFAEGRLQADSQGWHSLLDGLAQGYDELSLPPQVAQVVRLRLATLAATTQRVLGVCAVAGHAQWLEPLAQVAELPTRALGEALGQAQSAGLLQGRRFAHELLRQAVLGGMPEAQQAATHAAWLKAAQAQLSPHACALHAWAAGDEPAAVQACEAAAVHDAHRGLHAAAETLLAQGLQRLAPDSPLRAALRTRRAQVWLQQGRFDEAWAEAAAVLADFPGPAQRAQALVVQADVALQQGRVADVQPLAEAALQAVPDHEDAWMLCVRLAHAEGRYAHAENLLRTRLAALRQQVPGPAWAAVLTSLASMVDFQGRHAEALPLHEEALAVSRRLGQRYNEVLVVVNMVWCLPELGRADEAMALGQAALALGDFDATPTLLNNLAYLYLQAGRLDEAAAHYQRLAQGPDLTLACVAQAKLLQVQSQQAAGQREASALHAAAQALLAAMARTDHAQAHAIAVLALLEHGPPTLSQQALQWVPSVPVDAELQARLGAAVARAAG